MNSSPDSPAPALSILCFGAGAIGTYLGGSLALQGHRVVFLERPRNVAVLQKQGLNLTLDDQTTQAIPPLTASSLPEALQNGPFDLILFALKSYHTDPALQEIQPLQDQMPPFLCLQNGVENENRLRNVLGEERVIPGTVTTAVRKEVPGTIIVEKKRGVGIARGFRLSIPLKQAFQDAGLNPRLYSDSQSMKWSKLLTNLLGNASSAILDLSPGQIFAHPELYRMELRQFREALAVMQAQDIQVVPLPGVPVPLLAGVIRYLPAWLSQPLLSKIVGGGRGEKMPSFHIDLHSGRSQSEVEDLNGAVVRAGESLGIPTPVNRILTETLLKMIQGEIPRDAFAGNPEKLLNKFPTARPGE